MSGTGVMEICGHRAVIRFDAEIGRFRGEFVGLAGGADFYADSVDGLRHEGEISLKVFLEVCREKGFEPRRPFSGKFQVRVPSGLHARAVEAAASRGVSLNQLVESAIEHEVAA